MIIYAPEGRRFQSLPRDDDDDDDDDAAAAAAKKIRTTAARLRWERRGSGSAGRGKAGFAGGE